MHHRISDILTHFEKRLGEGVTEDPCWWELKDLLDGPASQVVKFQVANVSGMPGFSAYAAGSLVNAGSSSIPLEEGKGMVILDVEAHFNDTEMEAEDGSAIPELCLTHRRDLLVENLMHEFGHVLQDYFGKELRCDTLEAICAEYRRGLQETRALTLDFPGQHALSCWFGLSYASFLVLPRVLMEAMDDPWKERMAALLNEMGAEFPNAPDVGYTVRSTDGKNGNHMVKTPEWVLNYRHPDRALIVSFRSGTKSGHRYGFDGDQEILPPKGWVLLPEGAKVPRVHREYHAGAGWAEVRSCHSTMTPPNARIWGSVRAFAAEALNG